MRTVENPNRGLETQYYLTFDAYNIAESLAQASAFVSKIEREQGLSAVELRVENNYGSVVRRFLIVTFKDKRRFLET